MKFQRFMAGIIIIVLLMLYPVNGYVANWRYFTDFEDEIIPHWLKGVSEYRSQPTPPEIYPLRIVERWENHWLGFNDTTNFRPTNQGYLPINDTIYRYCPNFWSNYSLLNDTYRWINEYHLNYTYVVDYKNRSSDPYNYHLLFYADTPENRSLGYSKLYNSKTTLVEIVWDIYGDLAGEGYKYVDVYYIHNGESKDIALARGNFELVKMKIDVDAKYTVNNITFYIDIAIYDRNNTQIKKLQAIAYMDKIDFRDFGFVSFWQIGEDTFHRGKTVFLIDNLTFDVHGDLIEETGSMGNQTGNQTGGGGGGIGDKIINWLKDNWLWLLILILAILIATYIIIRRMRQKGVFI